MAQAIEAPLQPRDAAPALPAVMPAAPLQRVTVDEVAHRVPRAWARLAIHVTLLLGSIVMIFPFYWMVVTSFKTNSEAISSPPTFIPHTWHPENYAIALAAAPFARYFVNTLYIAFWHVGGVLVVSSLAAYAFARMEFYGKSFVFTLFLATMMLPGEATLIPNFVIITKWLGWYNTYQAQFITGIGNVVAIFLLRQFFLTVPKELHEAAVLDGCSQLRFLWDVVLPLSKPALITVALLNFLGSWNAYLWPLLVTSTPEMRPIQLGLVVFRSDAGSRYAELMAASTLVILPTVVLFLAAQKYFVESIARTGVKG